MAPTNKAPSPWPPTKYRTNARQYNKQIARSHADDGSRMTRCALLCAAAAPMHFDGSCRCDCHRHPPRGLWPVCVCRHRHRYAHTHTQTQAHARDMWGRVLARVQDQSNDRRWRVCAPPFDDDCCCWWCCCSHARIFIRLCSA